MSIVSAAPYMSVVTTVLNDLDGLKRTINSVRSQDARLEHIVIDGGSTSNLVDFLASIKVVPKRFNWTSGRDKGIYDGMNKGLELVTGDVVVFLNAGDEFSDSSVARTVMESFSENNWEWAVGIAVRRSEVGDFVSTWEYMKADLGGLALGVHTFCHQAVFYTTRLLQKIGPYKIDNFAADHLLNVKACKNSAPWIIPSVTTYFYNGGASSQKPFRAYRKDLRRIRIEENLLIGNSKSVDLLFSYLVVFSIYISGGFGRVIRICARLVNQSHVYRLNKIYRQTEMS